MTFTDFNHWCGYMKDHHGWRDADCARALYGMTKGQTRDDAPDKDRNMGNQIKRWRTIVDPPHYIDLACSALVAEIQPWSEIVRYIQNSH